MRSLGMSVETRCGPENLKSQIVGPVGSVTKSRDMFWIQNNCQTKIKNLTCAA